MNVLPSSFPLVIISGPSGVGKGTMIARLFRHYPEKLYLARSVTTRRKRSEDDPYIFWTESKFFKAVEEDAFLEYCQVHHFWYGTLRREVFSEAHTNRLVILEIDTQGAQKVKKKIKNLHRIFIAPPTLSILRNRLEHRQTESVSAIEIRLDQAKEEIVQGYTYDMVILNHDLDYACDELIEHIGCILDTGSLATTLNWPLEND